MTLLGAALALGGRFAAGARCASAATPVQELALVVVPLTAGALPPPAAAPAAPDTPAR
ncbi:hypothetical protein ACPXCX_51055 [Streptomyces sp. DT225]